MTRGRRLPDKPFQRTINGVIQLTLVAAFSAYIDAHALKIFQGGFSS